MSEEKRDLNGSNDRSVSDTRMGARDLVFDARTDGLTRIVGHELTKARGKFAPFNSPHEGWAVIREELDELWEHVKANTARDAFAFDEAIQVAAMALRFAYDLSEVSAWELAEAMDEVARVG